jgi:uncharacterized membrane protein
MRNLLLFLHLAAAIFWIGGMGFTLFALRPALHAQLQPPQRLPLMTLVLQRFFVLVIASIVVLLATGVPLLAQVPGASAPPGWHAMAGIGVLMMLLFAWLYFVPWRRLQRAVELGGWSEAGQQVGRIAMLVQVNFVLGWLAIAAVLLWR